MNSRIPQIRVKAILNNSKNEVLFSILNKNNQASVIKIPVGNVLYNESAEVCVKRIISENTPYEVEPIAILGVYSEYDCSGAHHFVTAVFICIVTDFCDPESEIKLDYRWLNSKNLHTSDLNGDDIKILSDYSDWRINKSTYWTSKSL